MIAYSIVFLRRLVLMVTLVLCSRHLLAEETIFYLVEQTNELEAEATGPGTPVAILEVPHVGVNPSYFTFSVSGLNVTALVRYTAQDHIARLLPHIKVHIMTLLSAKEVLFALLKSGSGTNINIAAAGESPERSGMQEYKLSIELKLATLLNEKDLKRLAEGLTGLEPAQVTYLMTGFDYDEKKRAATIVFKIWTPDLAISEKKMAQRLDGFQYRLEDPTSQDALLQEATGDTRRTAERNTSLDEGNLTGIAAGNDPAGTAADADWPAVTAAALLLLNAKSVNGK